MRASKPDAAGPPGQKASTFPPTSSDTSSPEPPDHEDADARVVLDPSADPGGAALGTTRAEAAVNVPWPLLLHRRVQHRTAGSPRHRWWVLAALLTGLFALSFTFTVFVVALPTVAREFHTHVSVLTWVSTGPLLAFGLGAPLFGKVGDVFGHRRLYLWGLAGAMVSAVLTATAFSTGELITARCLDGVQAGATGTASMALILRRFGPGERVKAMGWWSMVGAGGPVIGVSVGSPIIQYLGWRALFWVQLALIVVALVAVAVVLPAHARRDEDSLEVSPLSPDGSEASSQAAGPHQAAVEAPANRQPVDWVGSWTLSAAVIGVMLALSLGPVTGWTSAAVFVPLAVGLLSAALFVRRLLTAAHPLIPPAYFRRRNFVLPMSTRAFLNFAYFGGFFLFPLLMEVVYKFKETPVGLISIARPLVFSLSAPVAGYLAIRTGERAVTVFGSLSLLASMVIFASLSTSALIPVIVIALCLSGLGMGVSLPATASTQSNEVAVSELGIMSATQLLATQLGEVAGIQVLVTIQQVAARHAGLAGLHGAAVLGSFRVAFVVGAGVALGGVLCALFIRDFTRRAAERSRAEGEVDDSPAAADALTRDPPVVQPNVKS